MSKKIEEHVLKEYSILQQMGSGAYGHVWEVRQKKSQRQFALKKVFDAFRNSIDAQRTYREVQILRQVNCDCVVKLFRVIKSKNKKDLYLIFEFMQADLHSVVGSNILQKMHQVFVFYQILKGLKYIHSAQLIHRDLKPSNVLLNSECEAKLCDFGLVRTLNSSQTEEEVILSEEVATKWYRAPELLLGSRSYSKPIDVWSFGCIVAQVLTGKPMFAGDSTLNQLEKILEFTGEVSPEDIQSLDSPVAEQLTTQIKVKKKSFREYFSSVDPDFWVLLKGTLQFNPNKRITISEALNLELFDQFRQEIKNLKDSEKVIKPRINDNARLNLKVYRQKIYEDIDKLQKRSHSLGDKRKSEGSFKQLKNNSNQEINQRRKNVDNHENKQYRSCSQTKNRSELNKKRQPSSKILNKENQKPAVNRKPALQKKILSRKYQSLKALSAYQACSPYVEALCKNKEKRTISNSSKNTSYSKLSSSHSHSLPGHKIKRSNSPFKYEAKNKFPVDFSNQRNSGEIRNRFKKGQSPLQHGKLQKKKFAKQNRVCTFNKNNILQSIGFC